MYRTVILPVVLFGCETWSLTMREERRLRDFWEEGAEGSICARKGRGSGEWIRLHYEELNDLYCLMICTA